MSLNSEQVEPISREEFESLKKAVKNNTERVNDFIRMGSVVLIISILILIVVGVHLLG